MDTPIENPVEELANNQVRAQYDQLAAIYDQRWQTYTARTLTFLQGWAQLDPQASVLDVACGTGALEVLLLGDAPTRFMTGVDFSSQMLAVAARKCDQYPNVHFQPACASALPFAKQSFDVVLSANAFHYFSQPVIALSEMRRVLKPGGSVVILDWCKDFLFCRLCDLILPFFDPAYRQCYTQAQLHGFFRQAGLSVTRAQRVRFGLVWGMMVATGARL
jgi:ubiquinone/menaquinone biosynthesis C-methylase UbiE